ncbi:hemerythrin domain-containing protein [Microbacterium pygmaeum]|uniref:Hemerythrin HHE cation binding domain-containing protein n=1 Tax=Microbacterium pygmaeum TaxID=370764 RepID=A0A1G7W9Q0_9MICO|nr:hemerythrin domain-containing protein [Microbacterium pygmaeum]SDG68707.1 Hemerythrin HHE cation binding domain-containing protein [Microbacterium pygmaeum]
MAVALPSSGTTSSAQQARCDTDDMKLVHGLLRLLFREAPDLVRSVGRTHPLRRDAVSAHVSMISGMLHGHHRTEDSMLWDALEQRAPSCAVHVSAMRRQHDDMAALLAALDEEVAAWNTRRGPDDGSVVATLERIRTVLETHLGAEEVLILPVAQLALSQKEWDLLGKTSQKHTPKDVMFVQLGYLIQSLPERTRRDWVRANLPFLVRALWATIGRRRYSRYRAAMAVEA